MLTALQQLLLYRGVNYVPEPKEAPAASYEITKAIVQRLDFQLARHEGHGVGAQQVAPNPRDPHEVVFPLPPPPPPPTEAVGPGWDEVFNVWRDFVLDRPRTTTVASQSPLRDLRKFCEAAGKNSPADIRPVDMTAFVDKMVGRGLAVKTVNGRLNKIRQIFKVAARRHVLESNAAVNTLGRKQSGIARRTVTQLPFDTKDLQILFGSDVFVRHLRSQMQSGEATY